MLARTAMLAADFAAYPPQAKQLALTHLPALNLLPPIFAALLLRELIGYDQQFPAERTLMEAQLRLFAAAWSPGLKTSMDAFDALPLPPELKNRSPAQDPVEYVDRVTAHLWTAHAIEAFRAAGTAYGQQLALLDQAAASAAASPPLVVVLIGRGASARNTDLFRKLRPHGTLFTAVKSEDCFTHALAKLTSRAASAPRPYAHWYIDGDQPLAVGKEAALSTVSYAGTAALRNLLLEKVHTARVTGTVGPEDLRTMLARLTPEKLGVGGDAKDQVMRHFELRLLTEGSGTQVYSTSFVQWASREALRRARPETMLVRYAPRQAERSLNELLLATSGPGHLDPEGSLTDADMGAYYTWLNLQRLASAQASQFVAIFEEGTVAVAISPAMARQSVSTQPCTLKQILEWVA